jgi:hypothetical protein
MINPHLRVTLKRERVNFRLHGQPSGPAAFDADAVLAASADKPNALYEEKLPDPGGIFQEKFQDTQGNGFLLVGNFDEWGFTMADIDGLCLPADQPARDFIGEDRSIGNQDQNEAG